MNSCWALLCFLALLCFDSAPILLLTLLRLRDDLALSLLQLFASGLHTDDHFFTSEDGGASVASSSMHSVGVGARREGRSFTDGGGSGARKASKSGGMFGRVNPTELARDVERMNAEVCRVVWCGVVWFGAVRWGGVRWRAVR